MSELADALQDANYRLEQGNSISPPYVDRTLFALAAAARRQVALEPDQCGSCAGMGVAEGNYGGVDCPTCHGRGWLYKPETVEAVAKAIYEVVSEGFTWDKARKLHYYKQAVAVLDALRSLDQEAPR